MRSRLTKAAVGLLVAVVVLELGLAVAGFAFRYVAARDSASERSSRDVFRILCIGDSNTYSTGVERHESYPAQLQALLQGTSPDGRRFEVVNLGVPGTNSGQLLGRLPDYIERFEPQLLVVLIGANDYWNPAEMDDPSADFARRLHRAASRLRLYRLVLLTIQSLDGPTAGDGSKLEELARRGVDGEETVWLLEHDGLETEFRNPKRSVGLSDREHAAVLRKHLDLIVGVAEAHGVPLVLPTYAANLGHYAVANRTILSMPDRLVVSQIAGKDLAPWLEAGVAAGEPRALFFNDMHPRAPLYAAFARNLHAELLARRLVPGR